MENVNTALLLGDLTAQKLLKHLPVMPAHIKDHVQA